GGGQRARAGGLPMNEIALRLAQHLRTEAGGIGDLALVLDQIAVAGKLVARELARASLVGRLGTTGAVNVQGEVVKKLDVWANEVMVKGHEAGGLVRSMAPEGRDAPPDLVDRRGQGKYVVCFDAVEGSANVDENGILVLGAVFGEVERRVHLL